MFCSDHDDSLGTTQQNHEMTDLAYVRGAIRRMRPTSQRWVQVAAAVVRWTILTFPGMTGGIAVALVFCEMQQALEPWRPDTGRSDHGR